MRKLLFVAAFAFLVPAAASAIDSAADSTPKESWRADYDAAVVLIKAGKYGDGIARLKSIGVTNADVNNQLGFAYRKSGKWDEAVRYYEAALKADPSHVGALEYYGEYFVWKGDLGKARAHLARIEKACGGKSCAGYRALAASIAKKAPN
jgi:tetratricopeptide (TPR) repeat protein